METQKDEAAAPAAADEATTDAVVHPTEPVVIPDPVPEPHGNAGDPSVEEIEELRREALEDEDDFAEVPAGDQGDGTEIVDARESALEEIPVNVIPPTVGRKVWFRKHGSDINGQPEDATIVYVHSDHLVNLFVVSANGEPRGETSIPLVHDGEERPEEGLFAEWMPFQKGQARAPLPHTDRVVTLGDTVYYGNKAGQVSPAIVTHVYDDLEPMTGTPSHVDLQVLERERVWNAMRVERADLLEDGPLNGWMLKA